MPYVVISTQIRLETGPTNCGDEWSDPALMEYLGASLITVLGNNFKEYRTPDPARVVLNKLEMKGYKVVAMTGVGQTCIWTLHNPDTSLTQNCNSKELSNIESDCDSNQKVTY